MKRASKTFSRLLRMLPSGTARDCLTESLTGVASSPRLSRPRTSLTRSRSLGKASSHLRTPGHLLRSSSWVSFPKIQGISDNSFCQVHGLRCRNLTAHEAVPADFRRRSKIRGRSLGPAGTAAFHHIFSSRQQRHPCSGILQASADSPPRFLNKLQLSTTTGHGKAAQSSQAVAGQTQADSRQRHA